MINFAERWTTFTQEDVNYYNNLIFDTNLLHYNEDFCKDTVFKAPIVPGLLSAGLIGGLLGSNLPDGAVLLGQALKFIAPIYIGERIRAVIMFKKQRTDKPIITFETIVYKANREIAIHGEAIVKV